MKAVKKQMLFTQDSIQAQVLSIFEASVQRLSSSMEQHQQMLASEQVNALTKRYLSDNVDQDRLDLEAMCQFLDINAEMAILNDYVFPTNPVGLRRNVDMQILHQAKKRIHYVLGEFDEDELLGECKHSSGASIGVSFWDTSLERKMSNLTYTLGVDRFFSYYLTFDSEMARVMDTMSRSPLRRVDASRASCVPKDNRKSRLIFVEPTLNMFFQQGLMSMIERRLVEHGIDFGDQQEINRSVAWKSSITGEYATVDFSSASDRISMRLVEYLLPPKWLSYLLRFRSKSVEIGGSIVELNTFSTMGNAYTFPLETLIFWSIAEACCDPEYVDSKQCHCFGDDVLIPVRFLDKLLSVCKYCHFKPNPEKTFYEGRFRESCGGDYYAGKDVRPYYLQRADHYSTNEDVLAWLNILFNRLKSVCIRICGPLKYLYSFHDLFSFLLSMIEKHGGVHVVPTHFPDDAGLKIGLDYCRWRRWYKLKASPISRDVHGSYYFRYLTFKYREKLKTWSHLRYCIAIKKGASRPQSWRSVRKIGNYVFVSSTATPWFTIDT